MIKYIKSEMLKTKKSKLFLYSILIPFICGLFSVFFGGTFNALQQSIYWWTSFFLPINLEVLVFLDLKLDEEANRYFNINILKSDMNKVLFAKILVVIIYGVISNLFMTLLVCLFKWSMPSNGLSYEYFYIINGMQLLFLTQVWVIPLTYYLLNKMNGMFLISISGIIFFIVAPFLSATKYYFCILTSFSYKVMKYIFMIKESGDILNKVTKISSTMFYSSIIISFLLFIILLEIVLRRNIRYD